MTEADQTTSGRTPNPALRAAHDARLFVAPFNRRIGEWRTQIARLSLYASHPGGGRLDAADLGEKAAILAREAARLGDAFELRLRQLDARACANSRIEDTRKALASVREQAGQLAGRFSRPDG